MTSSEPKKWLLLFHQIPPKPNALRVKIWRRLQQIGAVAIKQPVYAMSLLEAQSREGFSRMLKEIIEGGGDGSIGDEKAIFKFINDTRYSTESNELRFDIYEENQNEMDNPIICSCRQSCLPLAD